MGIWEHKENLENTSCRQLFSTLIYIYIWLNFEKDGSLDFRLKTGATCFQAIGAVWELGGPCQDMPV